MTNLTTELRAMLAHLDAHPELPDPVAVHIRRYSQETVTVQLHNTGLADVATALVAWAETITDPSAEVWSIPDRDLVHLSVSGRLPDGTSFQVFDVVDRDDTVFGPDIEPGATQSMPLFALRSLTDYGTGVAA